MDQPSFDVPRLLAAPPLFGDLNAPELERLATGCQVRRLERGAMVHELEAARLIEVDKRDIRILVMAGLARYPS